MKQRLFVFLGWGLAGAGLALAGCSEVKEARRVQGLELLPPGQRIIRTSEAGLGRDSELTLERAVEIGLKYNPSAVQAMERLESVSAQLEQARSGSYPQVSVSAGTRAGTTESSNGGDSNSTSYSGGLSVSQLLYDFDRTPASIRRAYQERLAAEYDLKAVRNSISFSITEAYYNVIRQESAVRLSEETMRQNEKYLEQARSFFEVGTKIKYDITKAEVNLGNAQLGLISTRNALFVSRQVLNNAMGLVEDQGYRLVSEAAEVPASGYIGAPAEELLQLAKARNPEIKAQESRVQSANASVDGAVASLWPSLSLTGAYSFSGSDFPLNWARSISAALSMDLFKGGQKTEAIRSATSGLKSARTALVSLEQRIFLDITRARTGMLDASQKLEVNRKILQQAEENLNFIEQRYRIGKASAIELTDAQVSLTTARENIIQARFNYLIARAALDKIVSGE